MTRRLAWLALTMAIGAAAGFVTRARAAGVPEVDALTYTGYLESEPGVPLEGEPAIELRFFGGDDDAEPECAAESAAGTALVGGRFQLTLPKKCVDAVHAHPGLVVEVKVDGQSLGKTQLGAVPYALEAGRASAAGGDLQATLSMLTADIASLQKQLTGLTTGCPAKSALRSIDAAGKVTCAPANDVVQVRASVKGTNGGDETAQCPAGYTLVSAALESDARTSSGINGWDNGGNVGCGISGNTLTASLHNYQNGTVNTVVSCTGLCIR